MADLPPAAVRTRRRGEEDVLRVLVVAPPWFPVPPNGYGGAEEVCAALVRGLVALGHDVEMVGNGASRIGVPVHAAYFEPLPMRINEALVNSLQDLVVDELLESGDFDVLHDNTLLGRGAQRRCPLPSLTTVHNPLDADGLRYAEQVSRQARLVGVSATHISNYSSIAWHGYVHNGVPTHLYTMGRAREQWLLYLGRCSFKKGIHTAIDAARASGVPLKVAAKCNEPRELAYFEAEVAPRLGPGVEWLGEVDFATKVELLQCCRALLNPVDWREPFGLVLAEAASCGTPVVALRRGAVPEVVADGVTGWVCDDADELPDAIKRVDEIDPAVCRRRAVEMFDEVVMARRYVRIYRTLTGGSS